ncbi:MAG: hypothetical protein ACK518_02590 [bacterium]
MTAQNVQVRKITLANKKVPTSNFQFPNVPKLYLELLENKEKVKQNLVNQEYVPQVANPEIPHVPMSTYLDELLNIKRGQSESSKNENKNENTTVPIPSIPTLPELKSTSKEEPKAKQSPESSVDDDDEDDEDEDDEDEDENSDENSDDGSIQSTDDSDGDYDVDETQTIKIDTKPIVQLEQKQQLDEQNKPPEEKISVQKKPSTPFIRPGKTTTLEDFTELKSNQFELNKRTEDKGDEENPKFSTINFPERDNYKQYISTKLQQQQTRLNQPVNSPPKDVRIASNKNLLADFGGSEMHVAPPPQIPSLKDLNVGQKVVPNLNYMASNAEEENNKRELLFKFELLKKSYKDSNIPEFSMHSDYKTMKQTYENTVRKLSIESSVDNYKTYLIGGFMVVEFILGSWMGFDMEGFTQHQISTLGSYERLLVELGEKSYVDEESQWPVEVRLLGMIIMNAAFFIVSKLVTKKTGSSNILNFLASMNSARGEPKKTRPMKGPKMDYTQFPNVGKAS